MTLKLTTGWYYIKGKIHEHSLINEITCKEAPPLVLSSQGTYQTSVLASRTSPKLFESLHFENSILFQTDLTG